MSDIQIHNKNAQHVEDFKRIQDKFLRDVYDAHMKRFEHVAEVHDTEKLQGVTAGQLRKEFTDKIRNHIERKSVNVHKIPLSQLILT